MEEFGQIRYGTDTAYDNKFYFRGMNANSNAGLVASQFQFPNPDGGLVGAYNAVNSNNRSFIYSISPGYQTVATHYGLSFNQATNEICVDGNGNCSISLGMDNSTIKSLPSRNLYIDGGGYGQYI